MNATAHPPDDGDKPWAPEKVRHMAEVLVLAAPIALALGNLPPAYIQETHTELALKTVLRDPADPSLGHFLGDYLREMRDTPIAPAIDINRYNAAYLYIDLSKDSGYYDKLLWMLPGSSSSYQDETKINMFYSAIQFPLRDCTDELLDSQHGGRATPLPTVETASRITSLAQHLKITAIGRHTSGPTSQIQEYTREKLASCLMVGSGMKNLMIEYFRAESKFTNDSPEMIDFVRALTAIRTNLERSAQKNGIPCAPQVPMLTQSALDKLSELKSNFNTLESQINISLQKSVSTSDASILANNIDATRDLIEKVEKHLSGILSTRAAKYSVNSKTLFFTLIIWIMMAAGIYKMFKRLGRSIKSGKPATASPPHTPTTH